MTRKPKRDANQDRTLSTTRVPTVDEHIRFAIADKRLMQLSYGGKLRIVEPHDYGLKKGEAMLLAYQRQGSADAKTKELAGWRLLFVSKISDCAVLEKTFRGSRGDAHQNHRTWDVVYARVA